LRKLPALQKEVYDKLLQAEKIEQEQSEKNAAILLKQRDAAQLMFSNSENALAALNEQLTKERSILQAEMRAVREGFSKQTNYKGQLCLPGADSPVQESPATLLARLDQELSDLGKMVSLALCNWEELRNGELVALRDLCELIEKSGVKRNQDRQTLLQLAGKLEALMLNKEAEHKNEPAEYAWKERLPHNYSDNVNITNDKPVSPTNAEPTGFTSLLLYGDNPV